MQSAIPLDYLLRFLPLQLRGRLVAGIERKDPSIAESLDAVTSKAYDFYDELFEREGPQAANHYGWLMVEMTNFYSAIGLTDKVTNSRYEAWRTFINPQVRGHDDKAHRLIIETSESEVLTLFRRDLEVAEYYARLQPSDPLLKQFPDLKKIIDLAKQYIANPLAESPKVLR